jgi:1-acyl-sn-glycerol-3-phosphate acyltransferase
VAPATVADPRSRTWHLFKYGFVKAVLGVAVGSLLRVRFDGRDRIPDEPYVLCFSHPSWVDAFMLVGCWPGPRRTYILGPREQDMRLGWRNRLIAWTERGVPFQPGGDDLLDATRRASAVLSRGHALAVAGEGRLSDREGEVVPFVEGPAFFALRHQVAVLPVGIVGTRWLRFGKTVRFIIGEPIAPPAPRVSRAALATHTAAIQHAVEELIRDRTDGPLPSARWQWFSEVFNERPWLDEPADDQSLEAGVR